MFQPHKNILTDFLGQIFPELFQFKTKAYFGTLVLNQENPTLFVIKIFTAIKLSFIAMYFFGTYVMH